MTANKIKSYFAYLNKLLIVLIINPLLKNLLMLIILLKLENLRQILNVLSLKLMIES